MDSKMKAMVGGGVVLVVVLIIVFAGGGDSYNKIMGDRKALLDEITEILKTVKDGETADAARDKLKALKDDVKALEDRQDKLVDKNLEEDLKKAWDAVRDAHDDARKKADDMKSSERTEYLKKHSDVGEVLSDDLDMGPGF